MEAPPKPSVPSEHAWKFARCAHAGPAGNVVPLEVHFEPVVHAELCASTAAVRLGDAPVVVGHG